jgi:hypothetical protein
MEMEMVVQTSQPSPGTRTQEAPAAEWSSQEDNTMLMVTERGYLKDNEKETQQSPNL